MTGGVALFFPMTEWAPRNLGPHGYTPGMETALASPVWLRIAAVLTAGIV